MINTQTNKDMTTLTKAQTELFNTLVRLGDSKELALKTVITEEKKENSEMYYKAYCL